jgi:hypothetical protein
LLDGWRDAPLDPQIRGAFELLDRRATDPSRLTPAHRALARAAGL